MNNIVSLGDIALIGQGISEINRNGYALLPVYAYLYNLQLSWIVTMNNSLLIISDIFIHAVLTVGHHDQGTQASVQFGHKSYIYTT